jgi:hypothetical protein
MGGSGRGLILSTIPAFAWRDWGKPRKTSVRITNIRAEILTQDLQNMKQECCDVLVGFIFFQDLLTSQ